MRRRVRQEVYPVLTQDRKWEILAEEPEGGPIMSLILQRGEMWARNDKNIEKIPGSNARGRGIYILFDGSTPVYIGRGNIRQRIRKARASKRRGQCWDHFSWYVVSTVEYQVELEALLLRMLPPQARILNRQRGKLPGANKHTQDDEKPEPIRRPHIFR